MNDLYKCGVVNVIRDGRKVDVEEKRFLVHQFIEIRNKTGREVYAIVITWVVEQRAPMNRQSEEL
jgi:hypothetical protein